MRFPPRISSEEQVLPSQAGIAVAELLVAIFVLATLTTAIVGLATLGTRTAIVSEQRTVAQGIANQEAERIRALPYDLVGYDQASCDADTTHCDPDGVLTYQEDIERNNQTYTVIREIILVDDPENNCLVDGPDGTCDITNLTEVTADFKQVFITVSPPTTAASQQDVQVSVISIPIDEANVCANELDCNGGDICCNESCQQACQEDTCPAGFSCAANGCGCVDDGPPGEPNAPAAVDGLCPGPFVGACLPAIGQLVVIWQPFGGVCLPQPQFLPCGGEDPADPWCDIDDSGKTDCGLIQVDPVVGRGDICSNDSYEECTANADCNDPNKACVARHCWDTKVGVTCPLGFVEHSTVVGLDGNPACVKAGKDGETACNNSSDCTANEACVNRACRPWGENSCGYCEPEETWVTGAGDQNTTAQRTTCCYSQDRGIVTEGGFGGPDRPCRAVGESCTAFVGGPPGTCEWQQERGAGGCKYFACSTDPNEVPSPLPVPIGELGDPPPVDPVEVASTLAPNDYSYEVLGERPAKVYQIDPSDSDFVAGTELRIILEDSASSSAAGGFFGRMRTLLTGFLRTESLFAQQSTNLLVTLLRGDSGEEIGTLVGTSGSDITYSITADDVSDGLYAAVHTDPYDLLQTSYDFDLHVEAATPTPTPTSTPTLVSCGACATGFAPAQFSFQYNSELANYASPSLDYNPTIPGDICAWGYSPDAGGSIPSAGLSSQLTYLAPGNPVQCWSEPNQFVDWGNEGYAITDNFYLDYFAGSDATTITVASVEWTLYGELQSSVSCSADAECEAIWGEGSAACSPNTISFSEASPAACVTYGNSTVWNATLVKTVSGKVDCTVLSGITGFTTNQLFLEDTSQQQLQCTSTPNASSLDATVSVP